jgi:excinuclease ABC subunit C
LLYLSSKMHHSQQMQELQTVLKMTTPIHRFECYDVSHMMGEATVASCVVFGAEGPIKSGYRRYNIQNVTPGDDVAAMHQVLLRRFKVSTDAERIIPDVVFIDGGKTQLNAANEALKVHAVQNLLLVGISKGPDRKAGFETLHFLDRAPMHLPADSKALHLIQQIRDEAHRFAITGHRLRRDKVRRQSSLESIAGIGAKRRRDLLRYFGGIQGIAHASLDELMKVPGINRSLAERIFAALHDATI